MALDLRSSELEHSFIKERISSVEKHFSEISLKLAAYIKKLAQVRDSGDDLAGSISSFASKENLNLTLRKSLMQFTDILKAVQEYRDTQIQRINVKIYFEFANYKPICQGAKSKLKISYDIRAKELNKKTQLEKTRGKNPTNWQKIAQAEKEASQAQDEATRTTLELSKRLDSFEQQKLQDIKHTFLEFIRIELAFHTKAIELYTTAYNSVKGIKVDEDLKEFRSHFRSYTSPLQPEPVSAVVDEANITVANMNPNANKNADHFTNMSNTSLRSSVQSKSSLLATSTPNTSFKSSPLKKVQGPQKLESSYKPGRAKMENSNSSFESMVESKFELGDHCL